MKKKGKKLKFLFPLAWGLHILLSAVLIFLTVLTVFEWTPSAIETAEYVTDDYSRQLREGQDIHVLSWNVGYAALDKTEDFFMDGGSMVRPDSAGIVQDNLSKISSFLESKEPDVVFLQEVDKKSKRSYKINEVEYLGSKLSGYSSVYALNFSCLYVPYPFPTIGRVNSGIYTLTKYPFNSAQRYQLSLSYKWPVRMANLKRCMLVDRLPIQGSDKELVLVNFHLEAYAPLAAKERQTYLLKSICVGEYEKGNYVIAGGDWNMTFPDVDPNLYPITETDNYVAESMDPELCPSGWSFAYDESVPTCRLLNKPYDADDPGTQYYVIDGFMLSPNVRLQSVETVDLGFENSDHNPVDMHVVLGE